MLPQTAGLAVLFAASWWNDHAGAVGLVSVLCTLLGILIAIIVYLLQRDRKTFDWQLLTDEPIITSAASRTAGGITVLLNGNIPLEHPRLLTVRLMNTGKREIREDDFDGRVIIKLATGLEIKIADTIRCRDGMRNYPDCYWEDDECHVGGVLYNRGDWVDIQLLVDRSAPRKLSPMPPEMQHIQVALIGQLSRQTDPVGPPVTVDAVIAGQTRPGKRVAKTSSGSEEFRVELLLRPSRVPIYLGIMGIAVLMALIVLSIAAQP